MVEKNWQTSNVLLILVLPQTFFEKTTDMNKRILIVDDEPNIVTSLQFILQQNDYEVDTANNGMEAIQQIELKIPHLILLDVIDPSMFLSFEPAAC
mgnify:CR=1 FL=1